MKLEEDDILADVLGDLDTAKNKTSTDSSTASTNSEARTKVKEKSEDAIVKDYMQSFLNSLKKREEPKKSKSDPTDDEIINRVLRPENKIQPTETAKNIEPEESEAAKAPIKEAKKENGESKTSTPPSVTTNGQSHADDYVDNIDFSILDDDENQFVEEKVTAKATAQSVQKVEKPTPKPTSAATEADFKHLLDNWENICNMDNFEEEMSAETQSETISNGDGLKMWYWDAWEDPFKRPGQVFLFGKVGNAKENKSVCVHVENVDRCLYLLPREYVSENMKSWNELSAQYCCFGFF